MNNDDFSNLNPAEQRSTERRAKYFWVGLVVTLLGIQLVIGFVAFRLATTDPTVSVVPDYHQSALNWDQQRHIATAAQRLGWTVDLVASDVADGKGRRALEVAVRDQDGQRISDLNMHATAYHHAAASDTREFSVDSVGDGKYMALAPMKRSGIWNLEIQIVGADEPMKVQRTVEVIQ